MNDNQYLEWIASHLETFRPGFNTAQMTYVDGEGYSQTINIDIEKQVSDLDLLKACIDKANYE